MCHLLAGRRRRAAGANAARGSGGIDFIVKPLRRREMTLGAA